MKTSFTLAAGLKVQETQIAEMEGLYLPQHIEALKSHLREKNRDLFALGDPTGFDVTRGDNLHEWIRNRHLKLVKAAEAAKCVPL